MPLRITRLSLMFCSLLLLVACESDPSLITPSAIPSLAPTQQAIAIQTAVQQQFLVTAEAAQRYAPTQTIDAAVRATAQVANTRTAEYLFVITDDANRAITATLLSRTATQDALNSNPTNVQRTVDAQVRAYFTATARAELQISINETVRAAVEQTSTAQAEGTPAPDDD